MVEYPPYVGNYGQLKELFKKIIQASPPPKFTQDYLYSVLELKTTTQRKFIPFLKRLGFLDQANVPSRAYLEYRDESKSKFVMAEQIKKSYADLYKAHEYAHTLKTDEIVSKLASVLGAAKDDPVLPLVAHTFSELCKLADFEGAPVEAPEEALPEAPGLTGPPKRIAQPVSGMTRLGISYTINLNLPATTDSKVFEAIFKALKENILS